MEHISIRQRLGLEIFRRLHRQRVDEHVMRQLFWECTLRCNLSCKHCGSDCKVSSTYRDMPKEDFLRVIDSLTPHVDNHRLNIVITGGEPLMRNDLEDVGLELYRREYPWGIVTNGLALTRQRFAGLLKAGIHNMTISLDGLEEQHNWMRGNEQSFARAYEAIKMVANDGSLSFDVVTCVNRRSLGILPELKRKLIEAGVKRWRLFTIFPTGRAKQYPEFELDAQQFGELMEFIKATRSEGLIKASFCCEGFLGGYESEVRDNFYSCEAGISVASVLIDGSISACPSIRANYHQGNIYKDDLWTVWQERYELYRNREWMKTGICSNCKSWRYCQGNGFHLRNERGELMHCNLNHD